MKRECGDCRLCCKLLSVSEHGTARDGVSYTFEKPQGKWCRHSTAVGCLIYSSDRKPLSCRMFACLWHQGFGHEDDRPDRVDCVLSYELFDGELHVMAYEGHAGASLTAAVANMINGILRNPIVRAAMRIPPDLRKPRVRIHRDRPAEVDLIFRDPEKGIDMPEEATDADADRRRIVAALGPDAAWATVIDPLELSKAIERLGLDFEKAGR